MRSIFWDSRARARRIAWVVGAIPQAVRQDANDRRLIGNLNQNAGQCAGSARREIENGVLIRIQPAGGPDVREGTDRIVAKSDRVLALVAAGLIALAYQRQPTQVVVDGGGHAVNGRERAVGEAAGALDGSYSKPCDHDDHRIPAWAWAVSHVLTAWDKAASGAASPG